MYPFPDRHRLVPIPVISINRRRLESLKAVADVTGQDEVRSARSILLAVLIDKALKFFLEVAY